MSARAQSGRQRKGQKSVTFADLDQECTAKLASLIKGYLEATKENRMLRDMLRNVSSQRAQEMAQMKARIQALERLLLEKNERNKTLDMVVKCQLSQIKAKKEQDKETLSKTKGSLSSPLKTETSEQQNINDGDVRVINLTVSQNSMKKCSLKGPSDCGASNTINTINNNNNNNILGTTIIGGELSNEDSKGEIPFGMTIDSYIASLLPRIKVDESEEREEFGNEEMKDGMREKVKNKVPIIRNYPKQNINKKVPIKEEIQIRETQHILPFSNIKPKVMSLYNSGSSREIKQDNRNEPALQTKPELPSYSSSEKDDNSESSSISNDGLPPTALVDTVNSPILQIGASTPSGYRAYSYTELANSPIQVLNESQRGKLPDLSQSIVTPQLNPSGNTVKVGLIPSVDSYYISPVSASLKSMVPPPTQDQDVLHSPLRKSPGNGNDSKYDEDIESIISILNNSVDK